MESSEVLVSPFTLKEGQEIPVGTIIIVEFPEGVGDDIDFFDDEELGIPFGTLFMAGQSLSRELYPELSAKYAGTGKGSFREIFIENMSDIFLGFDENGKVRRGIACIYYRTVKWDDVPNSLG